MFHITTKKECNHTIDLLLSLLNDIDDFHANNSEELQKILNHELNHVNFMVMTQSKCKGIILSLLKSIQTSDSRRADKIFFKVVEKILDDELKYYFGPHKEKKLIMKYVMLLEIITHYVLQNVTETSKYRLKTLQWVYDRVNNYLLDIAKTYNIKMTKSLRSKLDKLVQLTETFKDVRVSSSVSSSSKGSNGSNGSGTGTRRPTRS